MVFIKVILSFSFILILFQDYKERKVYWFLFPIVGILGGILFYFNTLPEVFFYSLLVNTIFILLLVIIIFFYSKLKLRTNILNTIGLGDILIFISSTAFFSSFSFIIIFISALIFSLVLHLYQVRSSKQQVTVPLAGYMSLFFLTCYLSNWLGLANNLYMI